MRREQARPHQGGVDLARRAHERLVGEAGHEREAPDQEHVDVGELLVAAPEPQDVDDHDEADHPRERDRAEPAREREPQRDERDEHQVDRDEPQRADHQQHRAADPVEPERRLERRARA